MFIFDLTKKILKSKNKIPQEVEVFDPNGQSMGFANYNELADLRLQIKKAKVKGYYCLFEDEKIVIDEDGGIDIWPDGFFDTYDEINKELIFG